MIFSKTIAKLLKPLKQHIYSDFSTRTIFSMHSSYEKVKGKSSLVNNL